MKPLEYCLARRSGLVSILAGILGIFPAFATTYTVNSTADSGTGTLRGALSLALSGSDVIMFSLPAGSTIALTSDELRFFSNVTITGPGAANLTIKGNGTNRVFQNDGYTVSISGVTISNGGGNSATSNLYPGSGGAILNTSGTLTLTGVTVSSNAGVEGGAIANSGFSSILNLTNSTLSNNTATTNATLSGLGGAIFNYGKVTITGSTISNNAAVLNPAVNLSAGGGGILNEASGVLTISSSTLSGNSGSCEGGAIENDGGTISISNSTISGNSATNCSYGGNTFQGQAGGIENFGSGTISGSTISGNISSGSSGGLDNQGPMTITNSTFANNRAAYNGGGIEHVGLSYTLAISFTTFYGNVSRTSGFIGNGDGLANFGTASVKNSIFANSTTAGNCYIYSGYPLTSQNYNLSDDGSCAASFTQPGDLNNTPANLDNALAGNGGLNQTVALLGGPALDAIPVSSCTDTNGNAVTTDERGTSRPQGAACDMGAFEMIETLTSQTITFGSLPDEPLGTPAFTVSATATSGLAVTFNSQTSGICSVSGTYGATITLNAIGMCTIQATQPGDATYSAATPVSQSFEVTAGTLLSQTITFGPLANQVINASPLTLTGSSSSGLPVSFASRSMSFCTVSGSTVTLVAAGSCTVEATQGGNSVYAAAPPVDQSFQITLATQTISFGPLSNQPLTAGSVVLNATASSGLPVSFASLTQVICTVSGKTVTLASAGLCTVEASQAGNAGYAAAPPIDQSFQVEGTPTTYGTVARVTQQDQWPGDTIDFYLGGYGKPQTSFVMYGEIAIQGANPELVAITPNNPAGMTTGAWSESAQAGGSARGLAFRTFVNQTNAPINDLRLNAVLKGMFNPSPFGLPNAGAFIGGAIHIFDGATFSSVIANSGKTAQQFLIDGYSIATSRDPVSAITNLDSLFPASARLGRGAVYMANTATTPYTLEPYSTQLSANVVTNSFSVAPNQSFTVVFDAATASLTISFANGVTGGSEVNFLDTLEPAPAFFTDSNNNPVSGIVAVDNLPAGSLPLPPGSITLTPPAGSNVAGTASTITATVTDTGGGLLANAIVKFVVTSGPNAGTEGGVVTDSNGQAAFTYTGKGGAGQDTIQASIATLTSNVVDGIWVASPLSSGSTCNGTYNGLIKGNLTVSNGQNCILVDSTIKGNITVNGGSVSIANSTVNGNVTVQGASSFSSNSNSVIDGNFTLQSVPTGAAASQVCRTTVLGGITVQNDASGARIGSLSADCAGNRISGNLTMQNNAGATTAAANIISGSLVEQNNAGQTQVQGNTIAGRLQCVGNASITGGGNTVNTKMGQCSAF